MKKLIPALHLIFLFVFTTGIFSWDTTAAKFYPLAVGNLWSYHRFIYQQPLGCNSPSGQTNYIQQIVSDTIMNNGHRYFKFSGFLGNYYHRIDSSTMNVYQFFGAGGECLVDSLLARKNDTVMTCGSNRSIINDTSAVIFGGLPRRTKHFIFINGSRTIMYGIGNYTNYYCELLQGFNDTLNGCIINGIQYGNIIGINQISSETPLLYLLDQNYPNPFNPRTKIKFQISKSSDVKLYVYDILGRDIALLVNEELKPGTYETDFDGSDLPSGFYYYRLAVNSSHSGFTQTRKMVLVK